MQSAQKNTNGWAWEREYRRPQFLSLGTEPISKVRDLMRWVKKQQRKNPEDFSAAVLDWVVLDLGCGNGKNLNYIIENFCERGIGYDISQTAIDQANDLKQGLKIYYETRSIAEPFDLKNNAIDLVLDVTSSNSLSSAERVRFLAEVKRVLKPQGIFFVRTLCKDGDKNAQMLMKNFPGNEPDTYFLGDTGIMEHAFSKESFLETYGRGFELVFLEKTSGYQKWGNQSYKRNYWTAYFKRS